MKKQTFILEINDCQNQSWQGKIEWVQGQKKQSFRSVMELLRLMDSALAEKETAKSGNDKKWTDIQEGA